MNGIIPENIDQCHQLACNLTGEVPSEKISGFELEFPVSA